MKKIAIYTKGEKYLSSDELYQWKKLSKENDLECVINVQSQLTLADNIEKYGLNVYKDDIPSDTDLIVSYGGDGTLLHAVELFHHHNKPFLAINSGRLGFLASIPRGEIEKAITAIKNGAFETDERHLILAESEEIKAYAFNEFTLQKNALGMINVQLDINNEFVANYMSDGLIISTPSGSTAYSMSVGGPIVTPKCDCFVINPIAPHNLNMRPIIVEGDAFITVSGYSREEELLATIDNRSYKVKNHTAFRIRKSEHTVKLLKLPGSSFYHTIREKLMWGIDNRAFDMEHCKINRE